MNLRTQNSDAMRSLCQQEQHSRSHNDIIARRLKNRERQRRYRARKRLEADMKKAFLVDQSTPLQDEPQVNEIVSNCTTCVKSQRDWKKDARNAHAPSESVVTLLGAVIPGHALACEKQEHSLPSEIKAESPIECVQSEHPVNVNNNEANETKHGRRDWKAAARNRVDSSLEDK